MNSHPPAPLDYATPQPKGSRLLTTARALAWVWCGCFTLLAVPCLWAAAAGMMSEPGGLGWRVYQPGALLLLLAVAGAMAAAAATKRLRSQMPPDARPVVPPEPPLWQRVMAWTLVYVAAALILVALMVGLRR